MIKKIGFFSFSDEDALSHLRFTAAMDHLGIQIIKGVENGIVHPERVADADLAVLQRDIPREIKAYKQIRLLSEQQDRKIIFDIDDLLLQLSESHPDRLSHLYAEALLPILIALVEVDLVTVSSKKLRDFLQPLNPNIAVIENYLDDAIWKIREPIIRQTGDDVLTIAYMGSQSHRADVEYILPVLSEMANHYSGRLRFHFWGLEPPEEIKNKVPIEWTPVRSHRYREFVNDFQKLQADIFIAPLFDDSFNRCKSSIKFLEYSALGIPGVYSRLDPYTQIVKDGENGLLASSLSEWGFCLSRMIEDPNLRQKLAKQAQETVRRDWLMSEHAHLWVETYLLSNNDRKKYQASLVPLKYVQPIVEQLAALFDQRNKNLQTFESQIHSDQTQITELNQKNMILQRKSEDLQIDINKRSQLIENLELKLIKSKKFFVDLENRSKENKQKLSALQENIDQLEKSAQILKVQLEDHQQRVEILTKITDEKDKAILNLSDELDHKDRVVEKLKNHEAEHQQNLEEINSRLALINNELVDIKRSKLWLIYQLFGGTEKKKKFYRTDHFSWGQIFNIIRSPILRLVNHNRIYKEKVLIRKSSFFDERWYKSKNPDVVNTQTNPVLHYLIFGGFEGRDPGPNFSSSDYLNAYPDVRDSRINPLVHYLRYGINEGRNPKGFKTNETASELSSTNQGTVTLTSPENEDIFHQVYKGLVEVAGTGTSKDYVQLKTNEPIVNENSIKPIAFYLPQFHPFPENDIWWGKGFTEWTNVSKAVPQFKGHYQPRLPGELGFYDLRLYEVQERQIELARNYGIYGFCFHYYWFNGKRLLERPLNLFLEHAENNFPFCVCWANENWTRRWDGKEEDILIAQEHSFDNDKRFIADLEPILRDKRYIRINGRPVIIIYRPGLIKKPLKTAEYWREYCERKALGNPLIIGAQTFGFVDPTSIGFDASLEFPPHNIMYSNINQKVNILNENHQGSIYDYREMVGKNIDPISHPFKVFRTATPSWDNEARKPGRGFSFVNSTPKLYRQWLDQISFEEMAKHPHEDNIVFINAWNEWGESAYLEPDRKFGYAYLQATYEAILNSSKRKFLLRSGEFTLIPTKTNDTLVILHVYYTDLFDEISSYLENIFGGFDLIISLPRSELNFTATIFNKFPDAQIFLTENRGRDIAPFIEIYRSVSSLNYKTLLKLHTKKSIHREDGTEWRSDILKKLVGSKGTVSKIKGELIDGKNIGLIGPKGHILDHRVYWGFNKENTLRLAEETGFHVVGDPDFLFIAGSMFWAKPVALDFLKVLPVNSLDFEPEPTPPDGALAHAIERLIGLAAKTQGYDIKEIDENGNIMDPGEGNIYAFAVPYPQ